MHVESTSQSSIFDEQAEFFSSVYIQAAELCENIKKINNADKEIYSVFIDLVCNREVLLEKSQFKDGVLNGPKLDQNLIQKYNQDVVNNITNENLEQSSIFV